MENGSLFVWFPITKRWIEATWAGAAACALDKGLEVAYGRAPPHRPGLTYAHTPPLWRERAWASFVDSIASDPLSRHRLGSITTEN